MLNLNTFQVIECGKVTEIHPKDIKTKVNNKKRLIFIEC